MVRYLPFLIVLISLIANVILSGAHLGDLWQPLEFIVAVSVFSSFYLTKFGFRGPSSVDAQLIREVSLEAFWPSLILNLGLGLSQGIQLAQISPERKAEVMASVFICLSYSVLIMVWMFCLGKKAAD